jgi:hypothetical protein
MTDRFPTSDVGAWTGDDLANTARQYLGVGADADLPSPVRLLSAVARLANTRRLVDSAATDLVAPAIFLLRPRPPDELAAQTRFVPMVDNGLEPISGRLWFVSEVVFSGRYLELTAEDDAAMFSLVTDMPGSGDAPAVLYDPRTTPSLLRFYPSGIADPDNCVVVQLDEDQAIDLDRILAVVNSVYETVLVTPDAQDSPGNLWANSRRGWPSSRAEALIQMHIRTGLSVKFPTCRIRKEQPGIPGRLDLQVERSDPRNPGVVAVYAVLELKVLKSFRNTGTSVDESENRDAVDKGVRQAATYRDDRHAGSAALCCFDMRREASGDSCFNDVRDLAERLGVALPIWYVFSSSEAYREFVTG